MNHTLDRNISRTPCRVFRHYEKQVLRLFIVTSYGCSRIQFYVSSIHSRTIYVVPKERTWKDDSNHTKYLSRVTVFYKYGDEISWNKSTKFSGEKPIWFKYFISVYIIVRVFKRHRLDPGYVHFIIQQPALMYAWVTIYTNLNIWYYRQYYIFSIA